MTLFAHNMNPAPARRGVSAVFAAGALVLVVLGLLMGVGIAQQAVAPAIEVQEMKTALSVAGKKIAAAEEKVADLEKANALLQESLAEANRVGDEMRSQYEELLLRMASFGVDLVKPDEKSLEQRLLQAVRDRELAGQQKQVLAQELAALSEAVMGYLQTTVSSDPQAQEILENRIESASGALGQLNRPASGSAKDLIDGQVVSVDSEIGLLVLNIGRGSGVRIGLPLELMRDNRAIGTALVVDVRDSISGALLQETRSGDGVKVGDRLRPHAETL
ncbi:MAG: hypothetical protein KDN20_19120 [Verrucomicrobiae bacterium]|nr:hypothetical protein [Verrucomicrobiae bacterium]